MVRSDQVRTSTIKPSISTLDYRIIRYNRFSTDLPTTSPSMAFIRNHHDTFPKAAMCLERSVAVCTKREFNSAFVPLLSAEADR